MKRCKSSIRMASADLVVNLQGDFPTILPDQIAAVLAPLDDPAVDIATLAAEIHDPEEDVNPNVVKVVGSHIVRAAHARALLHAGDRADG